MKIVFLGTSSFAVPVLDMLAGTPHELSLVVAAPDRPQGRGRKIVSTPVAVRSRGLGLPLFQPDRINNPAAVERLRELDPDLIVVVAYGQILGRHVLELSRKGIVNLHGSLLPAWRGAAPIARGIQAGDRTGGVSLQFVVQEVDAGDVIDQQPVEFLPHENAGEASARLSLVAAKLLARNLDALDAETAEREPQNPAKATHAAQLEKKEGRIAWHRPAAQILNHVRAMTPWPSAVTRIDTGEDTRESLILKDVEVIKAGAPTTMPGTILRADDKLDVSTGYDAIRIHRLLRQGRKETDAASFLRGFPLTVGSKLQ